MKFKIVSINGNSVRVDIGISSIDIQVVNNKLILPRGVFIRDQEDFKALSGAVRTEYQRSVLQGEISINDRQESYSTK